MKILRKIWHWINSRQYVISHREWKLYKNHFFPKKNMLGACGTNTYIEYPAFFDTPQNIFLEDDVKIRCTARFVNSPNEKITIKQYTVVGPDCMIISNNHQKTVGLPQFLLGTSHIHDRAIDTTVYEDVWIGARVTIMPGANIGRGSIVGAGTMVTKPVPPYSVVVGSPARIIGKVFDKEDILEHEKELYAPNNRLTINDIDELFSKYNYNSLKTYGSNVTLTKEECEKINTMKKDWRFVGWRS